MDDYAIVLNAGSSSLKFCVYRRPEVEAWRLEARGQIEGIGTSPRFSAKDARDQRLADDPLDGAVGDGRTALDALAAWLRSQVRRRARSGCRSPRRAWRRTVRRSDHRHAAGSGGSAATDPARPSPSTAQPGGDRSGVRAASRRAAGRLLRHELPSRSAGCRGADSAAPGDLPRRRAALRLSRSVVPSTSPRSCRRSHQRSQRAASSWRIWAAAPACAP